MQTRDLIRIAINKEFKNQGVHTSNLIDNGFRVFKPLNDYKEKSETIEITYYPEQENLLILLVTRYYKKTNIGGFNARIEITSRTKSEKISRNIHVDINKICNVMENIIKTQKGVK